MRLNRRAGPGYRRRRDARDATVVAKPNAQINQVLASSEMKTRLQGEGAVATPVSVEAFDQLIVREIERSRPVVKADNI